jgi:EAL domain
METDSNSAAVVSTIIGLARALGVRSIAEGVETENQATPLRAAGCNEVQGYLYGRPAPLGTKPVLRLVKDGDRRIAQGVSWILRHFRVRRLRDQPRNYFFARITLKPPARPISEKLENNPGIVFSYGR